MIRAGSNAVSRAVSAARIAGAAGFANTSPVANTSALGDGSAERNTGERASRSCVTGEPFWDSRVASLCDTAALIRG